MFLPGGRALLFAAFTGAGQDDATIEALTLATGERKVLVRGGSQPRYAASGHLLYAVGSTLRAAAFDPERLELHGEPVPVQENVARTQLGAAKYAVSASGALAYVHGGEATDNVLVWVDREGREEPLSAPPRPYVYQRLSPDGTRIALDVRDEKQDVWIWDLEREASTRLTVSPGPDPIRCGAATGGPSSTPRASERRLGGRRPQRRRQRRSGQDLRTAGVPVASDGHGGWRRAAGAPGRLQLRRPFDVVLLDIAARAEPEVLLDADWSFNNAELSPDGRFLAYTSDESGTNEVFVRPFPALESGRWKVSSAGGSRPLWSRDGSEIFFLDGRSHLTAAPVTTRDGALVIGRPEVLFETAYPSPFGGRHYDVSLDGRRFLMIKAAPAEGELSGRIVYVQNWLDELRRLAPARGQ